MIKKILFCTLGSIFFAFGMKVPKNCILYVAVGSLITASCEIGLSSYYGELIACCTAMICLVIFCFSIEINMIPGLWPHAVSSFAILSYYIILARVCQPFSILFPNFFYTSFLMFSVSDSIFFFIF